MKVLDFGLAKAFQPDASDPGLSQSPTISLTAAATQMGMVIGTAAYMAPEQASGKVVDKRADVWAFGVVLYEMLTGTRPFVGDDVSQTLAHVIAIEPDWSALPNNVPPVLSNFLRRCLQKNPKNRVRDIGDVSLAMEGAFETGVPQLAAAIAVAQPVWRQSLPVAAAALLAGVLVSKYPPAKPGALVVSRSKRHDVTATRSLAPPKGGYSSNRSCSSRRSSRSCCWTYSRTTRSSRPTVET